VEIPSDDDDDGKELTMDVVMKEVNRIVPVSTATWVVTLRFRVLIRLALLRFDSEGRAAQQGAAGFGACRLP